MKKKYGVITVTINVMNLFQYSVASIKAFLLNVIYWPFIKFKVKVVKFRE